MSTTINFGATEISTIEYAVQSNSILGIRGSGKTYSATYIAECLMDTGIPVVAIDPVGVWRNLKIANPNGGKAYPVVVVGKDGDVPLSGDTIEEITRLMLRNHTSFVVDLFDESLSKSDWDDIVTKITKILLQENKIYGLRHVFFEEAAEFVHQHGKKTESSEWIERLVRMAGNVQVGCTFINQRSEQLAKSILELCDGLFLHRQKGRLSIKAIQKWLDGANVELADDISSSLPNLKSGECWIWMTSSNNPQRVFVPEKKTLHPNRAEFTFTGALSDDISSVIDQAKSYIGESVSHNRYFDYLKLQEPVIPIPPQPIEISTNIDWNTITDDRKDSDYRIYQKACSTRFASTTVAEYINKMIRNGWVKYETFGYRNAWLKSETDVHPRNLSYGIEQDYAEMVTRRIRKI